MYEIIRAVKFNGEYFENGDVVAVTTDDGKVIVGAVMIKNFDNSDTSDSSLVLDISEKYHSKDTYVYKKNIKNIQKVNI